MRERPTLAALRQRVHKDRHREIGNWLARRWARPSAVYGTWLAVRLGLSAHQVTLLAMAAGLGAAATVGSGTRGGFVLGALLNAVAFWLDRVDGQVARWRGTAGLDGVYLDYLMHHALGLTLGYALGHGLAVRTGDPRWSAAGFAIATGWTLLGLHNDCRYKAMFQRLKREAGSFRVVGGAGSRPAPPPAWPRRGLGLLSWPALKACEPHVVLAGLTVLAVLAVIEPRGWLAAWRLAVVGLAVIAPTLAAGRLAREVRRGAAADEFDRWFQPMTGSRPAGSASCAGAAAAYTRATEATGPHATAE